MDEKQWYDSLDKETKVDADQLIEKLKLIGDENVILTAYSEKTEDLPQLAFKRFLYGLKQDMKRYDDEPT